jgi:hypothetical protein
MSTMVGVGASRTALENRRVAVGEGQTTTVHVLRLPRADYTVRVARLDPVEPLVRWCETNAVEHALIGGFYVRAGGVPLGDLHIDGNALESVPFDSPWNQVRACIHSDRGEVVLRSRDELPRTPGGDLLQAGPMLVRDGVCLIEPGTDREGFSAGADQFDSDISEGRYPRAALGVSAKELIAAVCDGRSDSEAGLNLEELARTMIELGADDAINLDGGGSATLIARGELVNVPHEDHDMPIPGGRSVPTALRFAMR